jgi:lipopolysaccharide cholinephosphotransferase
VKLDTIPALQAQLIDMLATVGDILAKSGVDYHLAYGTALGAVRHRAMIPWDFDVDITVRVLDIPRVVEVLREGLPDRYRVRTPTADAGYEHLFTRVHLVSVHHKYAHIDIFPLVGTSRRSWLHTSQMTLSRILRRLFFYKRRARQWVVSGSGARRAKGLALWGVLAFLPDRAIVGAFGHLGRWRLDPEGYCTNLAGGYGKREFMPTTFFLGHETGEIQGKDFPLPRQVDEYLSRLYGNYHQPPSERVIADELRHFDDWYRPALQQVDLDVPT